MNHEWKIFFSMFTKTAGPTEQKLLNEAVNLV